MAVYHVNPGDTLSTVVSGAAAGDTFFIHGTHRLQQCAPKNNQSFIGVDSGKLIGAKIITFTWNGTYWVATGQTQDNGNSSGLDGYANPAHVYKTEELFINDVPLRRVTTLGAIGAGKWYFDYGADTIYLSSANNPTGQTVETTVLTYAFRSNGTNVSIQDLTIEKYGCHAKEGAIHSDTGPWLVQNCTVQWNHGAGIRLGLPGNPGSTVRRCTVYQNGQIGLLCSGTGGLVEYTDIRLNNFADFDWFWEAGGTKFANSTNLTVRHCRAANNKGFGLWTDINNSGTLYEYNLTHDNYLDGIFHEISYSGIIRYNVCINNGTRGGGPSMNRAGICVHNSSDVEIHDNYVVGYYLNDSTFGGGIGVWEQSRGSGNQGPWRSTNCYVHHNEVVMPGRVRSGTSRNTSITDNNVFSTNTFNNNTYYVDSGSRASFKWKVITDAYQVFTDYQAVSYAPDPDSTLVTSLPANYAAIPPWTLENGMQQASTNPPGKLDRNLRHNNLTLRPPGMLRVNREHPLARGLAWYVTPGGNASHDLIGGAFGNLMASASWGYVTEHGEALQSTSFATGGAYWEFPETLTNLGTDYTILVWGQPTGVMTYSTLLSIPVAPFSWQTPYIAAAFQRHSTTTQGSHAYSNSGTPYAVQSDAGYIQAGDPLTVFSVVRQGATVKFFRNGLQHGVSKTLGANLAPNVSAKQPITLLSHSSTNPDEGMIGTILVAAIWDRALTDQEMQKIAQDPWQVVRTPLVPRFGNIINPEGFQTTVSFGDVTASAVSAVAVTESAVASAAFGEVEAVEATTVSTVRPIRRFLSNTKFRPNTRLNRDHPLANGLLWYVAPGGRYIHDFVNGAYGSLLGSASWDTVSEYGHVLESTATTGADVASWPFVPNLRSIAKNFTIVVYAQIDAQSTNSHLLCIPRATDWGAQPIALALRRAGGSADAQALWGDSTNSHSAGISGTYLTVDSKYRLYAVTRNGTAARFYREGVLFGATTWSSNNDVNAFANEQPINLLARSTTNIGNGTDGRVMMAAIWDRTLTDEEIYWLQNDPFAPIRQTAPLMVSPNTIEAESFQVAVAFGDATAAPGVVTVDVGSVAEVPAAFGSVAPQGGVVTITMDGIANTPAFGDVTAVAGLVTIAIDESPTAAVAFGDVTPGAGTVTALPESVVAAAAFGTITAVPGAVTEDIDSFTIAVTFGDVNPGAIVALESVTAPAAFGDVTAVPGTVTRQPDSLSVPSTISDVTAVPGTVTVSPESIQAAAAFGDVTAVPGAVTRSIDSFTVPVTISSVSADGDEVIDVDSLQAPATFGTVTAVPGAVAIAVDSVTAPAAFGTLGTTAAMDMDSASAPAAFGDVTPIPGTVTLNIDSLSIPAVISDVTASSGIVTIEMEGLQALAAFGDVMPQAGLVTRNLDSIGQIPVVFGAANTVATTPIESLLIPAAFGNVGTSTGEGSAQPESIRAEASFGLVTIVPGTVTIEMEGIRAAPAFGLIVGGTHLPGSVGTILRRYGSITVTVNPTEDD